MESEQLYIISDDFLLHNCFLINWYPELYIHNFDYIDSRIYVSVESIDKIKQNYGLDIFILHT